MPQTTSWNIGVGVSCFVGAVGGMYLVYRGFKHIRKVKELENSQNKNEFCPICNTKIDLLVDTNWITCINCAQTVCRKPKCSKWIASRGQSEWECQLCHDQRRAHFKASEWLLSQLSKKLQISNELDLGDISVIDYDNQLVKLNESDVNGTISVSQKEYIRAFLEDLLSTLLGGSLDNVLVGPIRKSSDYLPICDHECPGLAQTNLKRLIQKIIAEAARLPELLNRSGVPPRPEEHLPYFDPKKYNQLLATAVLNKVVESYHNPRNQYLTKEEFETRNVDINQKTVKPEKDTPKEPAPKPNETPQTSAMKIESQSELQSPAAVSSATSQSVYSDDDSEKSEQLLETLINQQKTKRQLPDLTSDEANDEEYHSIKSVTTDSTWEDNWMFKQKKNTNDGSNSIAMLIPSPTEDVKVLIGDRTADEISDLSDYHDSDNDDEYSNSSDSLSDSDEPQSPADIPNVLVHNKTVIGGKHPLTDFIENPSDFESLTSQNSFSEAKNEQLIDDGDFVKVDKPLLDIEYSTLDMKNGNVEKMKEAINPYVERKVDSDSEVIAKKSDDSVKVEENTVSKVPTEIPNTKETIVDTPIPAPRKNSKGDLPTPNNASPKPDHYDDVDDDGDDEDDDDDNVDVDDSDFDLVSINSSEFSFYKPQNLNSWDDSSVTSPIDKTKCSFDVSNEEICKEILEMAAKQPQDIVVSTIPAVKEETKITISQTIWQPRMIPKVDSENTLSTADSEDLVEANLDADEPPVREENISTIGIKPSILLPDTDDSLEQAAVKNNKVIEEKSDTTDLNVQLSEIADISQEIQNTLNGIIIDNQVEPSLDNNPQNTIRDYVMVKEYVPEEVVADNVELVKSIPKTDDSQTTINEDVEVKESIPTLQSTDAKEIAMQEEQVKQIEDPVIVHRIETTDVKEHQSQIIETQEDDNTLNPQKSETTVLKGETVGITDLIQKLENISLTENTGEDEIKASEKLEVVTKIAHPTSENTTQFEEKPGLKIEIEVVANPPISVNVPEEIRKLEIILEDDKTEIAEAKPNIIEEEIVSTKVAPVHIIDGKIPTIQITPNTPISISIPETEPKLEHKLVNIPVGETLSVEITTKPEFDNINVSKEEPTIDHALDHHIQITDLEIPNTTGAINIPIEILKIESQYNDEKIVISEEPAIEVTEPSKALISGEAKNLKGHLEETEPIEIQADAVKFKIQPMDLKDNESNSVIVAKEVRKIEDKLEAVNNETPPKIQTNDFKEVDEAKPNEQISLIVTSGEDTKQIETKVEEVKVEAPEISIIAKKSEIVEERLEEFVIEPKIQTIEVIEIEPVPGLVTDEVEKNEESCVVPLPNKILPQIQTTDLKTDDEIIAKEQSSTEDKIENQQDLSKTGIHEIIVTVNSSQIIEPKMEESIIEPQMPQTTNIEVIETTDLIPTIVLEEVRKIEEKLATDLKTDLDATPKIQMSVATTDNNEKLEAKLEGTKTEVQEVIVTLNTSQIIEDKMEESAIEPQIQTTDINEIETSESVSVMDTEDVRKTDENVEAVHRTLPEPTSTKAVEVKTEVQEVHRIINSCQIIEDKLEESNIETAIQTTDEKDKADNEPISVIVLEEVREIEECFDVKPNGQNELQNQPKELKMEVEEPQTQQISIDSTELADKFEAKIEEVKTEIQEAVVTLNTSQIIEDKLEESAIEPQIQTTDIEEIETKEPASVTVTKEVQETDENVDVVHNENAITLPELISTKPVEIKTEVQEVPHIVNTSQIIEDKLEESNIETGIQTTDQNNKAVTEPIAVIVLEEVRKIEERFDEKPDDNFVSSLPVQIELQNQTKGLKMDVEEPHTQQISVDGTELIGKFEAEVGEVRTEIQEVVVTLNTSQIIEVKTEESAIEPQIQTTDTKETNEPVTVTVTEEVQETDKNVEAGYNENSITLPEPMAEVKLEVQEVPIIVSESQIIEEKMKESNVEAENPSTDVNEILTDEPVPIIVLEEVQKTVDTLDETESQNKATDSNDEKQVNTNEQISKNTTKDIVNTQPEVEEVKREIEGTKTEGHDVQEELDKSNIQPTQIQSTDLSEVPIINIQLPKLKTKLATVPQIKLVEFQPFPASKLPNQATIIQSPEPLQLTIKSEIAPRQPTPPIDYDNDYEIITESEIKTIPSQIESTMKSSKLVAGLTTKKLSTISLNLKPIPTVIEEIPTPPKSEAIEDNSLALNMQTIEQKAPGLRYSSPLFKPLLPTSPPPPIVKLTIANNPTSTTNTTNTSTSSIILDTTSTPTTKTNDEDEAISNEVPIPGSIAEREHNKWQNAAPIANNPYSVEMLERRLSQKASDSHPFTSLESPHSTENGKPATQEKLLVDVFKAEVPSIKRFGRDYYINEAKKASGERLRRSDLLNQQLHDDSTSSDDHANDSEYQKFLYVRSATEQFVENERESTDYPLQKSKSSGDTNLMNENIFAARPILVEEDDPILERAHRVEALSTDNREFFLLPIEEAQMNIGFSSSEASSLRSPSSLSEDSDTARVYNLRSQEIKKIKEPESKYIPPALKPKIVPKSPTVLKPASPFVPVITPAPPPVKLSVNTKIMSKSVPMIDTSAEFGHTNKRELPDDISNNIAIEEDLKPLLPSVKNLAKAFTEPTDKPALGPVNKPKTPWHSTSNLSKPVDSEVAPQKPQPVKIAEPFIRPGYSISGRSISKQVKDELREIPPKPTDSNNNVKSTVNSNIKVITPPRTPSPTPVPGALRNTLAFFENLNPKH